MNQIMKKTIINILWIICFGILIFYVPTMAQTVSKANGNSLDRGDFKVGFSPITKAKNPKKVIPKEFKDLLQGIADPLNAVIALPYDIYLNFDVCGEPNAFYSSATKEVTMCYEFLVDFEKQFKKASKDEAEIDNMVLGATAFFFFHELGHCLIDVWDLPATGREEDAVDQLSMIILLDGTKEGGEMVGSGALYFQLVSAESGNAELAFWDVHSVDQQRFYNMLCLLYGSNPTQYKSIIGGKDGLPPERAEGCPKELKRADRSWEKLLTPFLNS